MVIINPVPLPPFGGHAYTNITPFTYRDGWTFQRVLEELRKYIRDVLVPHVDGAFDELEAYVNSAIADSAEWTSEQISTLTTYVNEQVALIINNSVEVQDAVVAGIFDDELSATRSTTDTVYAPHSVVDVIETGRLSESNLSTDFAPRSTYDVVESGRLSVDELRTTIGRGFNIHDFGAVGDGVTDDTLAIQATIDAASAAMDRPSVFIPSEGRTYKISGELLISKPFFTFAADARTPSQYKPRIKADHNGVMLRSNAQGVTVMNIIFEGDYLQTATVGTYDGNVQYAIVMDLSGGTIPMADVDSAIIGCSFRSLKRAVRMVGRNLDFFDNLIVISGKGLEVAIYGNGIGLNESRGIRVENNRFHTIGWGNATILNGVDYSVAVDIAEGSFGNRIVNNMCDGGTVGLYRGPIDRTSIDGNTMYNMISTGIKIIASSAANGWNISNNTYVSSFNSAMYLAGASRTPDSFIESTDPIQQGVISGNNIAYTRKHAISLANAGSVIIANNNIRDANMYHAKGDGHVYDGIYVGDGNNVVITGNIIRSSNLDGEITHRHGINTAANGRISGNIIVNSFGEAYNVTNINAFVSEWREKTATVANFLSATHSVNQIATGKRYTAMVYCQDHAGGPRPHFAGGVNPTSGWLNADGSLAHTPV